MRRFTPWLLFVLAVATVDVSAVAALWWLSTPDEVAAFRHRWSRYRVLNDLRPAE
ncbi:MAG TPA: hypothetical protein VIF15_10445 [Polyangiaceae bacterium]|jgi:hypothetical protein